MSISLVKKSLNLVDTETRTSDANFNSPKRNKSRKRQIDGKKEATAVVQKIREKSKIEKEINRIDVNVQKLLNLSQTNQINKKSENKLLDNLTKKRKRKCGSSKEQKTVFTEEDFAKFEREYFVN